MIRFLRSMLATGLMGVSIASVAADNGERVFRDALQYTVQMRAAIATPFEGETKGTRRGAGFVIDAARGWVMTNAHVVGRSPSRVEVSFNGAGFVDAAKIYVDPHLDVAIVQVTPPAGRQLQAADLACGEAPSVGHPVGAFGHPWNMRYTGTRGIVSGTTVRMSMELLQTDAPINEGNSGGPLISLETGRIIGISTAQIRGSQNTNFAIGMKYACRIVELLRAGIDPSPPDLPVVYFDDVDDERVLKVARNYVPERGIALQAGDVILGVVGVPGRIQNETQLFHALRGRTERFALLVRRGGTDVTVEGSVAPRASVLAATGLLAGGVFFGETPLRDSAEVRVGSVMVHFVERGSDGEAKELRRGDFLEALNGQPVTSLEELRARLANVQGDVVLTFKRYSGGDRVFVYVERRLRVDAIEWIAGQPGPAAVARRGLGSPDGGTEAVETGLLPERGGV